MKQLTAQPHILKQVNLSLIRRVLKANGSVTRSEIATQAHISSTTVRSLLSEMLRGGEIESIGYDSSSGGRKAERYRFKLDRYYGAAFCITGERIHTLLVNLCGEVVERGHLAPVGDDFMVPLTAFLDDLTARREIKSIGLGVPGIVEDGGFWRKGNGGTLYRTELSDLLTERYGIPVVMENDLNAITLGFGRCYERSYPKSGAEGAHMAFLHFEAGCVSAGFVVGGRLVRGFCNYAGELGLIPTEGDTTLGDQLDQAADDEQYTRLVVRTIAWISGILNPQYIALGGPTFRRHCLGAISNGLYGLMPDAMFAEVVYAEDVWHDYYEGMAFLTAGKMFDQVQLHEVTL